MAENFTLIEDEEIVAEWANLVLTNRRIVGYGSDGGLVMLPICNIHSAGFVTASADWLIVMVLLAVLCAAGAAVGGATSSSPDGYVAVAVLCGLLAVGALAAWLSSKSTVVAVTAGNQRVAVLMKGHEQQGAVAFCRSVIGAVYSSRD